MSSEDYEYDNYKKSVLTEIVSSTDEVDLLVEGAYDPTESLMCIEMKEKAHHGGARSVDWCKKQDPSRPVDPLDDPDMPF